MQLTQDEKTFGMLAHLSALAALILPSFGNIIGPLIIWLVKKDQSAWVDKQGKESLNFQISMSIYFISASVITTLLAFTLIGIPLALVIIITLIPLAVFWLVVVIMAAVRVSEGEDFLYPLCIRFLK